MSNWVVNANAAIPFSGTLGSAPYPYVYYGDQAVAPKHNQAGAREAYAGRAGLSSAPYAATSQATVAPSWSHPSAAAQMRPWLSSPPPAGQSLIAGVADQPVAQTAPKPDLYVEKIHDLERELQSARAQYEKQQQEGRILLGQVESLTSELAAERHRAEELNRQVVVMSAAHQALQLDHERLISQHATIVREHEHMTSSQAAALRELEARHAEVMRLQRQLDEAQAAAAKASAEAAAAAAGQQSGTAAAGRPGASRIAPAAHARMIGHAGAHLSAAEEDKWALRLHKAERALEEERRVSEDLRHQLKAAEVDSRGMYQRLKQLEAELESPSGAHASASNSDPVPKSPKIPSPLSLPPPLFGTSSGPLAGIGSGPLPTMVSGPPSSTGALGRAASAGSGGISTSGQAGAKAGLSPGSAFAAGLMSGVSVSGGGTPQFTDQHEAQVARLKREVDGLRSDLTKLSAAEELHRVAVRAAEDRARAAELVSLDVRKQCDQAARTIGRLIDENSELVAKLNAQANVLADYKSTAASREATLRNLEDRLAQAQAQLAAAQARAKDHPPHQPVNLLQQQQPPPLQHHLSHGQPPVGALRANGGGSAPNGSQALVGQALPQPGGPSQPVGAQPGREVLPPGLTEADWKLVMLAEEVRRLVKEVSLSSTACLALQLRTQTAKSQQQHQQGANGLENAAGSVEARSSGFSDAASGEPKAASLDLERILSRLEGLAGRRLGPGETAAYIIELAGHMEALDQELQAQKRRIAALRGEEPEGESAAGPGSNTSMKANGSDANAGGRTGVGPGTTQTVHLQSEQLHHGRQQQHSGAQADSTQGMSASRDEGRSLSQEPAQVHDVPQPPGAAAAAALGPQDTTAAFNAETLDGSDSAGALAREAAFGSFVDGSTSRPHRGGTGGQQPPSLQPQTTAQPTSPTPAPPATAHHIVSPFNHLAQRKDSHSHPAAPQYADGQQPLDTTQRQQQPIVSPSAGVDGMDAVTEAAGARSSLDFRHTQRSDLAAAAAAAVAAVAAAEADRADAVVETGTAGDVAVMLPSFEAPPSPRAAPGAGSVLPPVTVSGAASGLGLSGVDALLEDDLLEEAAAGRVKPRRARVGLWGWISGESSR